MYREAVKCVDCGVEVARSGGRGRPRVRCQEHFDAFMAARYAVRVMNGLKDVVAKADQQFVAENPSGTTGDGYPVVR